MTPTIAFDNSYARELRDFVVPWQPARAPQPRLLYVNAELAAELGLPPQLAADAELWAGNRLPEGAEPVAQAYAGHQFGNFSPQLGDGRALLLGEIVDRRGQRRDLAFKGSGRTPFSRGGDGKAAVGPMLREVLIGEAMHALGVPTTRALAVVATGEPVWRDQELPGAVLTRVAASHLRVGTFQFVATRAPRAAVRRLADYAIARHDPGLAGEPRRHAALLRAVAVRQARLVAQWMNLGFIHGVMNTDNMTISGETIDYGPCAFLEAYDPATVFSSIDHGGRYAYGNQPHIARWNLARLAETLLPLMAAAEEGRLDADDDGAEPEEPADAAVQHALAEATAVIDGFVQQFDAAVREGQRAKLGLLQAEPEDAALADDWLALLQAQRADFTLAWHHLADAARGHDAPLQALLADPQAAAPWLARWRARVARDDGAAAGAAADSARALRLQAVNPWIIPRNHRVEEALAAASEHDDLGPLERLLDALRHPFGSDPRHAAYAQPAAPAVTACYRTFCGT